MLGAKLENADPKSAFVMLEATFSIKACRRRLQQLPQPLWRVWWPKGDASTRYVFLCFQGASETPFRLDAKLCSLGFRA